ncbi:MAG: hypothetical protein P8R54_04050 [Myxococcota bacterium]|nr:hypothetical protein [Myxococcota bacterium]
MLINLELSAESDYSRLDDRGGALTVTGLFSFLGYGMQHRLRARRRFRIDAPLRSNDLIPLGISPKSHMPEDLLRARIHITHSAVATILGDDTVCDELVESSSLSSPMAGFERVVLPPKDRARILSVIDGHAGWLLRSSGPQAATPLRFDLRRGHPQ